jgi:PHD/YefM family antitoxin component YafN of YafNO toxin-antitoxin module
MCHNSKDPIFITKNGYGDMVIMSMKAYEEKMFIQDVYEKVALAEDQVKEGKTLDAADSLSSLRKKYNV